MNEERIPTISIHPSSATFAEIADLAAELMDARRDRVELLDACKDALAWRALDGDGISDPVRSRLLAAIAKAEGK